MPNPEKKKLSYIPLDNTNQENTSKLDTIEGIDEWYINKTENVVIVKYDSEKLQEDSILNTLK
jgi:hypothetical protein